jgi:hypothetical protein
MTVLMIMTTTGCGMRYMVKGKIIDMDTGQPIEGAVVSILWKKVSEWLPGLGTSYKILEQFDCFTGPDGEFKIPKRASITDSFLSYRMAVYKKGYVCWENEDIFPTYEKRKGFRIKYGMTIELDPFKEGYSKSRHAAFVSSVTSRDLENTRNSKLYEATKEEREIIKKNWEEWRKGKQQ